MITNLPEKISTKVIDGFMFGDAEAKDDQLLRNCHVPTAAIEELLQEQKDIVLGYRGTGKSAMVRLFQEGIFSFKLESGYKSHLVVLDEEFDYRSIRNHLSQNALKDQKNEDVCRAVWEILVIYRVMTAARDQTGTSDPTLRAHINEVEVLLGLASQKNNVFDILLSHKKKVGVKFDTFHPNIVDTYIGIEPSNDRPSEKPNSVLKIGEYRKNVERVLRESKTRIYVFFDRLDDFVIHENYETQKLLLQELLVTQRTYREKCEHIKIKTFFRTDLFHRLNLTQFGADKIFARCIYLSWSSSDIKRFIAQRLGHNILKNFPLSGFELEIDQDRFFIPRDQLSLLEDAKTLRNFNFFKKTHWEKLLLRVGIEIRKKQTNAGRLTDSMDVIHEEIITSLFPRNVDHKKKNGEDVTMDLFRFFDTHLQFSHGQTTPRAALLFLNICLLHLKKYYVQNTDIRELQKDENGEFPFFVKVAITKAYEEFRHQSWDIQYQWAQDWKAFVAVVERCSSGNGFSFVEFKNQAGSNDDQARQFLAFATHTGLLKCTNDKDRIEERSYELPILFQKCKPKKVANSVLK